MGDRGIVVTVRGMGSKLSLGKIKRGEKMGSGISIEAVYYNPARSVDTGLKSGSVISSPSPISSFSPLYIL